MYKNAVEKINQFYELDLKNSSNTSEIFDVLNDIIEFDSAAIFYLSPEILNLEYSKNFHSQKEVKLNSEISENLYNKDNVDINDCIKNLLKIKTYSLSTQLTIKDAILGIMVIKRKEKDFSEDERIIFKTCSKIVSSLIKDLELSKILQMQIKAMQESIIETNQAYETIKKQNKKIKESEKLQNQFIANISHDLRTPLNSIIGFSDILANNLFGELNEKQKEYINDIRISGIKLLEMINEILDISKLESHTMKLNITDVDIHILIAEICNILKPLYEKKEITLTQNINAPNNIKGDYIKLQQILFNIIGNAIKFSPKSSNIYINVEQSKNNTIIKIKDNGIGIEKKYHKKVFNKFFQIQNALSKTELSTGLGLTIVKEFVNLHNGTIKLKSEKEQGTEFIITIPNMND